MSTTTTTTTTTTSTMTTSGKLSAPPIGFLAQHESLEWSRRDSPDNSRYVREFEPLEWLGRGAFGTARRVRNRLDGQVYCLKSIRMIPAPTMDSVVREVQVLSRLQSSQHVVRYYAAWVEKGALEQQEGPPMDDDEDGAWDTLSSSIYTSSTSSDGGGVFSRHGRRKKGNSNNNDPTCHLCNTTYVDWEVSFEHWGLIDSVLQPLDLCVPCYLQSIPRDTIDTSEIAIRQKQVLPDYLFILMEYCESTLEAAVAKGDDDALKWNYFRQCLEGVAHLHSKGVIHRDIKPNNIFVHQGVVKIGDLGLAKIIMKEQNNAVTGEAAGCITVENNDDEHKEEEDRADHDNDDNNSITSHVGTFLYMAPEVANGSSHYSEKCDIYSLGILLVEIFSNFTTGMERVHVLGNGLRNLPDDWCKSNPLQAQLARKMVHPNPEERPTCEEVLEELLEQKMMTPSSCSSDANVPSGQQQQQKSLTERVEHLQMALESSQQEANRLRAILEAHGISYAPPSSH